MAIPKNTKIPSSSSQFAKLQDGVNKFRFLSDVVVGWEGWKDNKPFRHAGDVCKITADQVSIGKNGKPNINYFWAVVVWNYKAEKNAEGADIGKLQVLQLTQKTIMKPLYDLETSEDWGDLKGYDVTINKSKVGDKITYTVQGVPPRPVNSDIMEQYNNTEINLDKLFTGDYPMEEHDELTD
jgi:hypothetical protein